MCSALLATALALAACDGSPAPAIPAARPATTTDALATIGDVSIRASVVQTSTLDATIARDYGIAR
ncbi:MAG: hypothetical protein ABIR20_07130, partial [Lysobacter sp.]